MTHADAMARLAGCRRLQPTTMQVLVSADVVEALLAAKPVAFSSRRLEWFDDRDEVLTVARWLLDTSQISTCDELLYLFEKPWKHTMDRDDMVRDERDAA